MIIRNYPVFCLPFLLIACGGSSNENPLPAFTPAPTGVMATHDISSGKTKISWSQDPGTSYSIYYSSDPQQTVSNYSVYADAGLVLGANSPTEISLPTAPIYYFQITAKKNSVESLPSEKKWAVNRYSASAGTGESVLDSETGLEWERCLRGSTWNPATSACIGSPTQHTGSQAEAMFAPDANGWRIPSESEIATLAFCNTSNPAYFLNTETVSSPPCSMHNSNWGSYLEALPEQATARKIFTTKTLTVSGSKTYCSVYVGQTVAGICAGPGSALGNYILRVR